MHPILSNGNNENIAETIDNPRRDLNSALSPNFSTQDDQRSSSQNVITQTSISALTPYFASDSLIWDPHRWPHFIKMNFTISSMVNVVRGKAFQCAPS